jgi:C-terminal processing protease CtpA/Prc
MRTKLFSLVFFVLVVCASGVAQKMVRIELDDKTNFLLHELGAVIRQSHDTLTVEKLLPGFTAGDENKGVALEEGDIVAFANGVRLRDIQVLHKMYDSLAIGGGLKLGVKRNGEDMIVDVHKAGQKNGPGEQVQTMMIDPDKAAMLPGIGVLEMDGKDLKVKNVMRIEPDDSPASADTAGLQTGDVVESIDGKSYSSIKAVNSDYKRIKTGDSVEFKVLRGGKETTVTIAKPKVENMKTFKRHG